MCVSIDSFDIFASGDATRERLLVVQSVYVFVGKQDTWSLLDVQYHPIITGRQQQQQQQSYDVLSSVARLDTHVRMASLVLSVLCTFKYVCMLFVCTQIFETNVCWFEGVGRTAAAAVVVACMLYLYGSPDDGDDDHRHITNIYIQFHV